MTLGVRSLLTLLSYLTWTIWLWELEGLYKDGSDSLQTRSVWIKALAPRPRSAPEGPCARGDGTDAPDTPARPAASACVRANGSISPNYMQPKRQHAIARGWRLWHSARPWRTEVAASVPTFCGVPGLLAASSTRARALEGSWSHMCALKANVRSIYNLYLSGRIVFSRSDFPKANANALDLDAMS